MSSAPARQDAPALGPLTRPPRLRPGDRVAVIAPSGPVGAERLERGCAFLRGWGLDVVLGAHVLDRHGDLGYLAGTDEDRAADLTDAWLDPSVAAVFCARGGYGAQRMLDLLDWAAMSAAAPKIFAGYSDITVLHEAFATHLGLVTLLSPMLDTEEWVSDAPSREGLRRILFEPESATVLSSPTAEPLVGGCAEGVTIGGTVSLIASCLGTPASRPNARGGIVVLEDITEEPYRLDGFLTHLLRAGWFDGVVGIALGSWRDCGPADVVRALMLDRLAGLGVPILSELGFGHCASTLTVPLGVRARLDADTGTLTLLDPPLS